MARFPTPKIGLVNTIFVFFLDFEGGYMWGFLVKLAGFQA
jgi:hypothetical protein